VPDNQEQSKVKKVHDFDTEGEVLIECGARYVGIKNSGRKTVGKDQNAQVKNLSGILCKNSSRRVQGLFLTNLRIGAGNSLSPGVICILVAIFK
jgi:hypothetical protein